MITLLIIIGSIYVVFKLIGFAFKFAWGISKALFTCLFLPVLIIGLLLLGLKYVVSAIEDDAVNGCICGVLVRLSLCQHTR